MTHAFQHCYYRPVSNKASASVAAPCCTYPSRSARCFTWRRGIAAESSGDVREELARLRQRVEQLTAALEQAGVKVPEDSSSNPSKSSGLGTRLAAATGVVSLILKLRQALTDRSTRSHSRSVLRRVPRRLLRAAGQKVVRLKDSQRLLDMGADIADLHVCGNASVEHPLQESERQDLQHPVLQALHERRRSGYLPGSCSDGRKIALAIEGGGMRGCVSAGMAAALSHPAVDLLDSFDCVYGSSAGAITAAYVVARQAQDGLAIFYDRLSVDSGFGREFIDPARILRPFVGLDASKPAVDLDLLLGVVGDGVHALNFQQLVQKDAAQPLRILASAPEQGQAKVLSRTSGSWQSLQELLECLRASALVPGICGAKPVRIREQTENLVKRSWTGMFAAWGNSERRTDESVEKTPLVDALFFEPLPYRSALSDGCTHVLVLRTVKDGTRVSPSQGFFDVNFEDMVYRSFARNNDLGKMSAHVEESQHTRIYVEDILRLNEEAARFDVDKVPGNRFLSSRRRLQLRQLLPARIMSVALQPDDAAIAPLELKRSRLLEGTAHGYARAYAALAQEPSERNFQSGLREAQMVLPEQ